MKEARPSGGEGEGKVVEVRARTVDEAVARGLVRLGGLSRAEVQIEVLQEGRGGLLGFGAEEAVVRLTVLRPGDKPAGPAPGGARVTGSEVEAPRAPRSAPEKKAPERTVPDDEAAVGPEASAAVAVPVDAVPLGEVAPVESDLVSTAPARAPREGRAPKASSATKAGRTRAEGPRTEPQAAEEWEAAGAAEQAPAWPASGRTGEAERSGSGRPADRVVTPEEEAEALAKAQVVIQELATLLGCEDVSIERSESLLPPGLDDDRSVVLTIRGLGTERLLADDARPLLALQFLVRMIVSRQTDHWVNLLLDVDGDRTRRIKELFHLAEQSADLVEREGRAVSLPPMSAYERRVVHLALREHPTVATQSIGVGDYRKVTVRLQGQLLPEL